MNSDIRVEILPERASESIEVVYNGKVVARIHAFYDGDLFINKANVVRIQDEKIEKVSMSLTNLVDQTLIYWHEIKLKAKNF